MGPAKSYMVIQEWTTRTTPSFKPIRLLKRNTGHSSSTPSTKETPSSQPETSRPSSTPELPSSSDQKPSLTNLSPESPSTPLARTSIPFQISVSPLMDNTIHLPPTITFSKLPNSDKPNAFSVSNPWTSQLASITSLSVMSS